MSNYAVLVRSHDSIFRPLFLRSLLRKTFGAKYMISTVQDFYNEIEVQDVARIRSEYNITDALTKVKKQRSLIDALHTTNVSHPVQRWIFRSSNSASVIKTWECQSRS